MVSDIHSNLEALKSVISDAESKGGFDEIWSLGDLVGYGPDPVACVDLIRNYQNKSVSGNHDLAAVGRLSLEGFNDHAAAANRWTAQQLRKDQVEYLFNLPLKIELYDFTLVHGSPRDPIWEYVVSSDIANISFMHFDTNWCIVGHSHIPFVCRPAENDVKWSSFPIDSPVLLNPDRMIINPGGVGQPRDGDPRASYVVYDSEVSSLMHCRVEYDIPKTQEKMRQQGLSKFLINRLSLGK